MMTKTLGIRFKDDHGNDFPGWEEKKLGEVGSTYSGLSGKSGDDFGIGKPYVTYKQIFDRTIIDLQKCGGVTIKPNENQNRVAKGDVLFTTSSETRLEVGYTSVVMEDVEELYLNSFCFGFRMNGDDELLPEFARYLFHSSDVRRAIAVLGQGSTRYNISKNQLMKQKLQFPSIPEQTKIADFLTAVDGRIGQLIQKKALLEDYKKGVMRQLFTQAIRFKDDHGNDFPDWEEKKLGEVGSTYSGLSGKSGDDFGIGKPYVTYKQIFDRTIIDLQKCGGVTIKPNENQNRVAKGDVLFTTSSETRLEVGYTSVVMEDVEELYLNSFCFGFRMNGDDELLPEFARYLFHSSDVRRAIAVLGQGSTRYNISKNQLMKQKLQFPSIPEQTKIADFLSAIDRKVESVATQISETQTFKRGLLQQMFV